MKVVELFAGVGGLALGLKRAGLTSVCLAEIDPFARRVLAARFIDTEILGDVTQVSGFGLVERHGAIDLVAGGSPCQDLSVAGKRQGLKGARSGLFHHQIRVWHETNADLCLWENVYGALSSNDGKDFGRVLSSFVGCSIPVPRRRRRGPRESWPRAGVVSGPSGVAAWRCLDAQYVGLGDRAAVPQRRLRVFVLGSRTGRVDPAEILLEPEGVFGDTPPRRSSRQAVADGAGDGSEGESGVVPLLEVGKRTGTSTNDPRCGIGIGEEGDPMFTLQRGAQHGVIAFQPNAGPDARTQAITENLSPTLGGGGGGNTTPAVLCVTGEIAHSLTHDGHDGHDGSEDGTGRGTPIILALDFAQITSRANRSQPAQLAPSLNASGAVHVFNETGHEKWNEEPIAGSLNAHEAREAREAHTIVTDQEIASTLNGTQRQQVDGAMTAQAGIPRRLMPVECERLMGWEDGWTDVPDPKTGKPASDSQRYKACGNGVVAHVSQWIGMRLYSAWRTA